MVIQQGRCAAANGVDQTVQRAVLDIVAVQRLVEAPPQSLENLRETFGRLAPQRHTAGEQPIEVSVCANETGHHHTAPGVQLLLARIQPAHFGRGRDCRDLGSFDTQCSVGNHARC